VNTVSTRPGDLADSQLRAEIETQTAGAGGSPLISRQVWLAAAVAIVIVGSALRLHNLELVPLHHDEGVNGFFLTNLFRTLTYRYNPENYHGPSLYYAAFVSAYLFGLNTLAIRVTTAAFGIATIWIILVMRRQIGDVGSLVGASLVAVSPGAVYFSRYFIHETLFMFFALGTAVGLLRYRRNKSLGDLMFAFASGSLLFATKETAIITTAVLLVAATITIIYMWSRLTTSAPVNEPAESDGGTKHEARGEVGSWKSRRAWIWSVVSNGEIRAVDWGSAAAIAVLIFLVLYSSFFMNPGGIADALKAFKFWARTGGQQHTHAWTTYFIWLWQEESPLLLLAALAALSVIWKTEKMLVVFASLWWMGLLAVYSVIPYKTPWLTLNFIVPMAIAVGCASDVVYQRMKSRGRVMLVLLVGAALTVSAIQCIRLNFYHYDDDRYAYVYAHTHREFLGLVNDIEEAANRAGTREATTINITSPDYWPLPWYLRRYTGVGYFGKVTNNGAAIVVGSETQQQQLDDDLGDQYVRVGSYTLRPGVLLVLYIRRDLAAQSTASVAH
jgi:uncharacterized protein (TIGR03663 family)